MQNVDYFMFLIHIESVPVFITEGATLLHSDIAMTFLFSQEIYPAGACL